MVTASLFGADQSQLTGHWEGEITLPNQSLEVMLDFQTNESKELSGTISIPAQNAKNLPLQNIAITDSGATFSISGVPGNPTFDGTFSKDASTLSGSFNQSGGTFSFSIHQATSPADKAKNALSDLDQFVTQGLKDWNVPGLALAVVVDNEVIYENGFGLRDVEDEKPVTPHTLFAIGSSTKAFTTFTLATLVDEGKMDWDTPVRNYIPGFRMYSNVATEELTPRDMVTHRSGLPRHDLMWYNRSGWTRKDYIDRLRYLEPSAELRQKFQYNNLMFLTAGYLAGQLTGGTWEEAVQKRILDPLGMTETNFSVETSQKTSDYALPYKEEDDEIQQMNFRNITTLGPAGSINSNIDEMSHWLMVNINNGKYQGAQILNPTLLKDIQTPHMVTGGSSTRPEISANTYGLGWFINTYRGHQHVSHGGNIDGFTALVTLFPDDGVGIVVLANKNGARYPTIVTRHIADRVLGLEPIEWNEEGLKSRKQSKAAQKKAEEKKGISRIKGTKPSHDLDNYVGEYDNPGYGKLVVKKDGKQLEFVYNNITTPLEHWHYDVFNGKKVKDDVFKDMKLIFRSDLNGNIATVEAPFEPSVDNIVFTKQPAQKYFDASFLENYTGKYVLEEDTLSVTLAGNHLKLTIPGQPTYSLLPDLGDQFKLKEYSVVNVTFPKDKSGEIQSMELHQPSGVFTAERLKK